MSPLPSDQPQTCPEDDALDRCVFSQKLAQALAEIRNDDGSVIIALYGEWGSGKSTIKNFTRHYLRTSHQIEALEFSPWEWAARDKLVDALFQQLADSTAGKATGWWASKKERLRRSKVARKFRNYAEVLGYLPHLYSWGKKLLLPGFLFAVGSGSLQLFKITFLTNHQWILGAGTLLGVGLLGLSEFLDDRERLRKARIERRQASLGEVRDDLAHALRTHGKPIITFIDDLDRLEAHEVRLGFSFLKAAGNLPRLVFVVLCQRDAVARALADPGRPETGDDFLEKIVQAGFNVPQPPSGKIQALLEKNLRTILADSRFSKRWDWSRWATFYSQHAQLYLRTPRQVIRFLGSFQFYLGQHLEGDVLEVNPVDLAALEILRLSEPSVLEHLAARHLGNELTAMSWNPSPNDGAEIRTRLSTSLVASASEERRPQMIEFIHWLFPQLAGAYGDAAQTTWDEQLRVCISRHYARYFQLVLPRDQATAGELERLTLAAKKGRDEIYQQFREFSGRGLIRDVLNRYEILTKPLSSPEIQRVFEALCLLGDELPERTGYGEDADSRSAAYEVARELLRGLDPAMRADWLQRCLDGNLGFDLPISLTRALNRKMDPSGVDLPVTDEAAAKLAESAINRIEQAAQTGLLWESVWLGRHLNFWAEKRTPQTITSWLASQQIDQVKTMKLVLTYVSISTSGPNQYPRFWAGQLDALFDIVSLAQQTERNGISLPESPRERDAVLMIREARNRKVKQEKYDLIKLNKNDP